MNLSGYRGKLLTLIRAITEPIFKKKYHKKGLIIIDECFTF